MKRKRFSAEQIVAVLKQAETGVPLASEKSAALSHKQASAVSNHVRMRAVGCDEDEIFTSDGRLRGFTDDRASLSVRDSGRLSHSLVIDSALTQELLNASGPEALSQVIRITAD